MYNQPRKPCRAHYVEGVMEKCNLPRYVGLYRKSDQSHDLEKSRGAPWEL